MAQYCVTRQAIWPYIIMLLLGCFCLFVAFGAVDLIPQRQRQSPPDQTKEILLVNVVRLTVFFVCLFFFFSFNKKFVPGTLFASIRCSALR